MSKVAIVLGALVVANAAAAQDTGDRAATKAPAKVLRQNYEISATGLDGIRQTMREVTLPIGLNRKAVASTNVKMTPNVVFDETPEACSISGVTVDVTATVTLPRWREYAYGNAQEQRAWNNYVAALSRHEDLHVAIGEEYGGNLQAVLEALPTRRTCDELRSDIARERGRVLDRHRTAQNALDARSVANPRSN